MGLLAPSPVELGAGWSVSLKTQALCVACVTKGMGLQIFGHFVLEIVDRPLIN